MTTLTRRSWLRTSAAFAAFTTTTATTAVSQRARAQSSDRQGTVDDAIKTINDLRTDKEFGTARDLLHRARAVLIVPNIVKAGFFFGGEGGNGVLLVRHGGGWSSPAFYSIGSASFGLQIGAQVSEAVFFIMSDRALQAVLRDRFKIGADAGITAVTLGSDVEASTTRNGGADIVVWASSSGAYIGLTINGSLIEPRPSYNEEYYGRPMNTRQVIISASHATGAQALVSAVSSV